ncbi:cupin domain-containing protein [Aestuariispira ectoiniformans]|uniref:cupin domain-containing protein n=1 Tax=Aestuariispira ectoiniformans TaxID=2775080 RepID=UPI00223BDCF2|nr:cupin domain-containing protein [Aestuariispira ectoiniformans]
MSDTVQAIGHIDNDKVVVTEWRLEPGGETGHHRHERDYVIVPLCDAKLRITLPDGSDATAEMKTGQSYFREAGVEHNVINASDHVIAFVEVELRPTGE